MDWTPTRVLQSLVARVVSCKETLLPSPPLAPSISHSFQVAVATDKQVEGCVLLKVAWSGEQYMQKVAKNRVPW
jgi:hypothetical protein